MRRIPVLLALGAASALAACDSAPTEPEPPLTEAEVMALAPQLAALGYGVVSSMVFVASAPPPGATTADPRQMTTEFSHVAQCPRGGQIRIEGSAQRTFDPATQTMTSRFDATQTAQDCGLNTRDATVVVNGNPNVKLSASQQVSGGKMVASRSTQKGSVVYQRGGERWTCDMDLTSSLDAVAGTMTIVGTMCGREVNLTHPLPPPPRG